MGYRLADIATDVGIKFDGDNKKISGLNSLKNASIQDLSFINSDGYISDLTYTKAAAVFVSRKHLHLVPDRTIPLVVDYPYFSLAIISSKFQYKQSAEEFEPTVGKNCNISKSARFGRGVVLGDDVTVMSGTYIGDYAHIGSDTVIYPNVSIYHHTVVGKSCIIHSGAVIGADGYGYARDKIGNHIKIHQNGNVVLGECIEIGANSTIDRATFGSTKVGSGTKIDNLVQVAHNCEIGKNCMLVCQTALAGSTILGDGVIMGGQSGATGHLSIGDHATIASRAGVTKTLKGNKIYGGFPALEHSVWLKMQAKLMQWFKQADS